MFQLKVKEFLSLYNIYVFVYRNKINGLINNSTIPILFCKLYCFKIN